MSVVNATIVAILNQFATSGTNFFVGVYLLRELPLDQFGLYGAAFTASMLLAGLGNSLLLGQMVILYPDYDEGNSGPFLSSVMTLIYAACSTAAVAAALLAIGIGKDGGFVVATVILAGAFLIKEFYVRLAYTLGREIRVVRVNATIAMAMFAALAALAIAQFHLTAFLAIACYAAAMLVGAIVGHLDLRLPFERDWRRLLTALKELWVVGKWGLVNDLGYAMRQHVHVLLTAAIAGTVGVGVINAARLLVAPAMMVTPAISQLYLARLVPLRKSNPIQLLRNGVAFSIVNGSVVLLYVIILLLCFPYVSEFLGTESLPGLELSVVAWGVAAALVAVRYGLESTQRAMLRHKTLAAASLPIGLLTLILAIVLLLMFGPVGSIYGYCIGELATVAVLAAMVRSERRRILITRGTQ